MKFHQIQVENPDINLYVAYGWHNMFYHSTAQMSHYVNVANTASTYSVSSGNGSSGGGFSGGGGGAVSVPFKERCHRLKKYAIMEDEKGVIYVSY